MEATTRTGMALDEFMREFDKQPFELINDERKDRLPNVAGHSEVIRALFVALYMFCKANQMGEVYSETTFILPDSHDSGWVSGSRIPDMMYFAAGRVEAYKQNNPEWAMRPFAIVPDMVIEVVSPDDRFSEVDEKVDAYLADGVRLVVVADPQRRKVIVHTPDTEQPLYLSGAAVFAADDVIPGFKISLPELFSI